MKAVIKLNDFDLDIIVDIEVAKNFNSGDILSVYDFDTKEKPKWVLDFIGNKYDDEPYDIFPVDTDYREENGYFKLKVSEREFREDEFIIWVDVYSNLG
jgi:hypothetical protein